MFYVCKMFAKLDFEASNGYNPEAEEGCPSGLWWRS